MLDRGGDFSFRKGEIVQGVDPQGSAALEVRSTDILTRREENVLLECVSLLLCKNCSSMICVTFHCLNQTLL